MYQTFKFFENKTKFPIEYVEKAEYFPIGEEMFRDMLEEIKKAKKTRKGKKIRKILSFQFLQ